MLVTASTIALAAILGVLVLTVLIIRAISRQVADLLTAVRFAMDNKGLTRPIFISSADEVGTIGKAINELFHNFGGALQYIDKASVQLATATEETSSTADQNAGQVKNQQQQIEQVAAATEEISATSEEISRNTQQVADAASSAMTKSRAGEHGRGFAVVADEVRTLARQTDESTTQIEDIINGFKDITGSASRSISASHKLAKGTYLSDRLIR